MIKREIFPKIISEPFEIWISSDDGVGFLICSKHFDPDFFGILSSCWFLDGHAEAFVWRDNIIIQDDWLGFLDLHVWDECLEIGWRLFETVVGDLHYS